MKKIDWSWLLTGRNAPWQATLAMLAFFCCMTYLANRRDDHFMIGFCCIGAAYNLNKLMGGK